MKNHIGYMENQNKKAIAFKASINKFFTFMALFIWVLSVSLEPVIK